ncbi:MAG: MNIO family bufferin maturase [Bryobacteraceae bacterium]
MANNRWGYPDLGFGVGLRTKHYDHILSTNPPVDWFEILSENYMDTGGRPLYVLDQVAERYPVVLHGVSMSVGSTDPVDFDFLGKLKALGKRIHARWISDHLCWTGIAGLNVHDLLPMPYTDESLRHTIDRVRIIQDFMEQPLVLENPSTYLEFRNSSWTECEFLARLAEEANCGILLDVNNVYVSAFNHGFDPVEYLNKIPGDRVVQIHLAGHTHKGTHILDTHSAHVVDSVWELYRHAYQRIGGVATLLEWDADIPDFEVVHAEALKARHYREAPTLELAYAS